MFQRLKKIHLLFFDLKPDSRANKTTSLVPPYKAVEKLMRNDIDILFSEIKLDETLPNQKYNIKGYKM